uniref:ABC-type xenobiotic transporter n=1 Tax=Parastrongyloides trichosuri TaxID=131310 RepID=A0A0N4Z5B2_PARTI
MLRYGSFVDWSLFLTGIVTGLISGIIQPLECIISAKYYGIFAEGYKEFRDNKGNYDKNFVENSVIELVVKQSLIVILILTTMIISTVSFYILTERQIKLLKVHYIKSILKQNMSWFEQNTPGKLSSSMSSIFEKIRFGLNPKLSILLCAIGFVGSSFAATLYYSYKMSLVFCGGVLIAVVPLVIGIKIYNCYSDKEYDKSTEAGSVIEEVFSGIKTVMSFNGQEYEINRYKLLIDAIIRLSKKKIMILTITYSIFTFTTHSEYSLILLVGYDLVKAGIINFSIIIAVISCIFGSIMRLDELVYQISKLTEGMGHIKNLLVIIDSNPEIDYLSDTGMSIKNFEGKVTFDNVSFTYPSRPNKMAVRDINFTILPGESCALVGYSGGGKSTVLNLLMRYYNLNSGNIFIDDVMVKDINVIWLRDNISIVFQEPILFTGTIKENILFGKPDATDDEIREACKIAYAENFINTLPQGYDTFIGEGGMKMSGGMKQRLCIARAVIRNPKILILDEATSALDATSEKKVLKALNNASKGRTTLAISHKINTIKSYDKILVFDQGEIVEVGKHEELLELKGLYYKLAMCENFDTLEKKKKKGFSKSQESSIESSTSESTSKHSTSYNSSTETVSTDTVTTKVDEFPTPKTMLVTPKLKSAREITTKYERGSDGISILQIIKYAAIEKKKFLLGFIFIIINSLQLPISVFTTAYIMDMFTRPLEESSTKKQYINSLIIYTSLAVIYALSYCACGHFYGFGGINLSKSMRKEAYKNILYQDVRFFDNKKNNPGRLTNILTTEALNINQGIDLTFVDSLIGLLSLVLSTGIAFYFNTYVAGTGFGVLIFFFFLSNVLTYINNKVTQKSTVTSKMAVSVGLESIINVKTIQAFNRVEEMANKFENHLEESYKYFLYSGVLTSISFSLGYGLFSISTIVSVFIGAKIVAGGIANPYHIIQAIDAISYVCFSLFYVYPYIPDYIPFREACTNLFEFINKKPKYDVLKGNRKEIIGNVEMKYGYFSYPHVSGHLVLKGMKFKVDAGKSLALVGPSGCGKTTVLQIMERFYDLIDGSLEIDGINVKDYNLKHYRNCISTVSQEPTLFNLTIKENICYGLENVKDSDLERVLYESNVIEFLNNLPKGINTECGSKGKNLSGGQKQRIAIARALVRNPKILLLDEATSALDTKSEQLVKDALNKACQNKTSIIVAHKLSTIQHCDCIAVVNNGAIIEEGTHDELLGKKGEYYKLINCHLMED